jgi:hypothetical protein
VNTVSRVTRPLTATALFFLLCLAMLSGATSGSFGHGFSPLDGSTALAASARIDVDKPEHRDGRANRTLVLLAELPYLSYFLRSEHSAPPALRAFGAAQARAPPVS